MAEADFDGPTLAAAVRVGATRLIDNVCARVDKVRFEEDASPMTELRAREPLTLPEIGAMKGAGTKIVMVTAYDHPSARLASEAGVDLILVGDSAGNNVLGYDSTVPVTMDEAAMLTAAVARAKPRALVIGDMPFGSFQASDADAVANAVRLVKAGADAVKLEGAGPMVSARRAPSSGPASR